MALNLSVPLLRRIMINLFVANLLQALYAYTILPARVAIHFGAGGVPNGWASKGANTLIFVGLLVVLFAAVYFAAAIKARVPPALLNLPNKAYWLRPENRARLFNLLDRQALQFGIALFIFLFIVQWLTVEANRRQPVCLNERAILVCLAVFLLCTVGWTVRLWLALRKPRNADEG